MQAINAVGFGEFKKKLADAVATLRTNFDEGVKKINELKQELTSNDWLNSVLNHPENLIDLPGFISYVNQIKSLFNGLKTDIAGADLGEFAKRQLGIDAMKDGFAKRKAQIDLNLDKEREQYKGSLNQKLSDDKDAMTVEEALQMKHDNAILAAQQQTAKKTVSTAKHTAKQTLDVQKETQRLELELMAEGYLKELTKMKQERDDQLRRFKGHNDLMLKAEQLYIKKSTELREKYQKEFSESYKKVWSEVLSYTLSNTQIELENVEQQIQKIKDNVEKGRQPSQYGGNTLFNFFTEDVKADLVQLADEMASAIANGMEKGSAIYKAKVEELKQTIGKDYGEVFDLNRWLQVKTTFGENVIPTFEKLADLMYDIQKTTASDSLLPIEEGNLTVLNDDLSVYVNNIEDIKNAYGQLLRRMDESWQGKTFELPDIWKLYDEQFKKQEEVLDRQRDEEKNANADWWEEQNQTAIDAYEKRIAIEEANNDKILELRKKLAKAKTDADKEEIEAEIWKERYLDDNIIPILEEREETLNRITDEALSKQTSLVQKYALKQEELERNKNKGRLESFRGYIDSELQETRDLYDRMSKVMEKARTPDELGFVSLRKIGKAAGETRAALGTARIELQKLLGNIYSMRDKIDPEDYKRMSKEILDMLEEINKKLNEVGSEPLRSLSEWTSKFNDYLTNISSYFQDFLAAFQETEDYMIQYQMDALDKENDELQKKLDENEKILERHKNNVDKIEGELSDARGDRRERLIDALNQEIIAQRRAQSEKEKLEKEQERLEKEQEKLEEKQKRLEYERGLQQILFNTAASISQASTTGWPMPAPIYMALAAAVGAAQYALAKQRKPYAEGGILDGLSHENGGISVGNSNIEVEGGEYVINKRSTANNTELLNLINNSDRQLTPSDLMNFATNMSVSPLEVNMPESSSLETAFVAYAQRPIVVDVREITSRQESVRNVQVLSGIR